LNPRYTFLTFVSDSQFKNRATARDVSPGEGTRGFGAKRTGVAVRAPVHALHADAKRFALDAGNFAPGSSSLAAVATVLPAAIDGNQAAARAQGP